MVTDIRNRPDKWQIRLKAIASVELGNALRVCIVSVGFALIGVVAFILYIYHAFRYYHHRGKENQERLQGLNEPARAIYDKTLIEGIYEYIGNGKKNATLKEEDASS